MFYLQALCCKVGSSLCFHQLLCWLWQSSVVSLIAFHHGNHDLLWRPPRPQSIGTRLEEEVSYVDASAVSLTRRLIYPLGICLGLWPPWQCAARFNNLAGVPYLTFGLGSLYVYSIPSLLRGNHQRISEVDRIEGGYGGRLRMAKASFTTPSTRSNDRAQVRSLAR